MRVVVGYLKTPEVEPGTILGPHGAGGYLCVLDWCAVNDARFRMGIDGTCEYFPAVGYATVPELARARERGLAGDVRSVAEHRLLADPAAWGSAVGIAVIHGSRSGEPRGVLDG